jgi:hypothetical protein
MQLQAKDENTLRKYLLGDVSPAEQEQIELWLMSDDEAYDVLTAAEDDLIDASLNGKLKSPDLDRFNKYFLAAPERQRKLAFDRSLRRYVKENRPASQPIHFGNFLALFFRTRPVLAYGCAALILLTVVAGTWSTFSVLQLQRELRSASDQLASVSSERETYKRQLDESRSAGQGLQTQLDLLERTIADLKSAPQALLTLNLIPGISRSSNSIQRITVPTNAKLVRFSLTLLDDNYDGYRVSLIDDGGRQLFAAQQLKATSAGAGKAIMISVPGEVFSNGDYSFTLSGVSNGQPPESITSYYFRVIRQ